MSTLPLSSNATCLLPTSCWRCLLLLLLHVNWQIEPGRPYTAPPTNMTLQLSCICKTRAQHSTPFAMLPSQANQARPVGHSNLQPTILLYSGVGGTIHTEPFSAGQLPRNCREAAHPSVTAPPLASPSHVWVGPQPPPSRTQQHTMVSTPCTPLAYNSRSPLGPPLAHAQDLNIPHTHTASRWRASQQGGVLLVACEHCCLPPWTPQPCQQAAWSRSVASRSRSFHPASKPPGPTKLSDCGSGPVPAIHFKNRSSSGQPLSLFPGPRDGKPPIPHHPSPRRPLLNHTVNLTPQSSRLHLHHLPGRPRPPCPLQPERPLQRPVHAVPPSAATSTLIVGPH